MHHSNLIRLVSFRVSDVEDRVPHARPGSSSSSIVEAGGREGPVQRGRAPRPRAGSTAGHGARTGRGRRALGGCYTRLAPAAATPTLFALFANGPFAGLIDFDEHLAREKAPVCDVPDS